MQEDNQQAEEERLQQSFERQWSLGKNCSQNVLQQKLELWQNFIILGFSQCLLTLYTFCFLHLLVRLELCVARRHEFNKAQRGNSKIMGEDSEQRREATSNRFKSLLNACSLLKSDKIRPVLDSIIEHLFTDGHYLEYFLEP